MHAEFRMGERDVDIRLTCTECGGRAEGNCSWSDGSGELCDKCVAEDQAATKPVVLRHYVNGVLESITMCELNPDVEMSILLSTIDPFCTDYEVE